MIQQTAYSVEKGYYDRDVFLGINDDPDRMQVLIDEEYFYETVEPKVEGEEFKWSVERQVWYYTRNVTDNSDIFSIVFDENFTVQTMYSLVILAGSLTKTVWKALAEEFCLFQTKEMNIQ